MTSIYSDSERETRYDNLRRQKKLLDRVFAGCMWLTLFAFFADVIINLISGFLEGLFLGNLGRFALAIFALGSLGFSIFAIYRKSLPITVISFAVNSLFAALGCYFFGAVTLPLLILACIADYLWAKLEKEEGFPDFQISFHEYKEREQVQKAIAENRAKQLGNRTAAEAADSNMRDLLDAGSDLDTIPAALHNYHERGQEAQAFETEREDITPDMKELEDI